MVMELYDLATAGAFSLVLLLAMDWSVWRSTKRYLSIDYEEAEPAHIPREFPNQRAFRIARILLGLCFVTLFVSAIYFGASEHIGLAVTALTVLVLFGVASFWESVRAFRYFAEHHLTPRPRGGYLGR
jgi:hypothetical protein